MVDSPDKVAYKVENGVIVNATVVDPNAPVEEGFIKRPYFLGIGYQEKFGDFYEDWVTKDFYDRSKEEFERKIADLIQKNEDSLSFFSDSYNEAANAYNALITTITLSDSSNTSNAVATVDTGPSAEQLQLINDMDQSNMARSMANRYIAYLKSFEIQNPVYQKIKSIGEI